jgi:pimeloyl-ACP methyl ester carboxylesterase
MSYRWQLNERGSGPAALLLPAFPFDARMWDAQSESLAASHRVIAPDMPGFGGAPAGIEAASVDGWAKSLLAQLHAQGVDSAIVAGCSLGGYFAFAILRADPGFIRSLALVDSRAVPDTADRKAARIADAEKVAQKGRADFIETTRRRLSAELAAYPSSLAKANAMLDDATGDGIIGALCAMAERPDSRPLLQTIRVPAAVIRGANDPIVGDEECRAIAAEISGATFAEIAGAGHIPTFERPDEVTAALFELAARTPRTRLS